MNEKFVEALPVAFQSLIKTVNKKSIVTHFTSGQVNIVTTQDKAFWLSVPEVFGAEETYHGYIGGKQASNYEGTQYQYYKIEANSLKYRNGNDGNKGDYTYEWFLRSPSSEEHSTRGYKWMYVDDSYASSNYGVAISCFGDVLYGQAPAFCL